MKTLLHNDLFLLFLPILKAAIIFIAGIFIAKFFRKLVENYSHHYSSPQQTMIVKKIVYFGILLIFLISAVQQLGFTLGVLLGSAGIITAAVGFASQTTISNMISGIFLILEKSFSVGDQIIVHGHTGTVDSIDLLSVKLISIDNTLVRIPNETILKTEIINLTKFSDRRLDIIINVAYDQDFESIREKLIAMALKNTLALKIPEPKVIVTKFGESGIDLKLSVWVNKNNYEALRESINEALKKMCDDKIIDMPFRQITVHMNK